MSIPKIIHYCWFGGKPLPELAQKCIESWEKHCPDYEIMRWDETNFDMNYNDYVREAYHAKKWAFITDVVRLYVMVHYGGFYMDTDVEVLKSLDNLRNYQAVSGFEIGNRIPTGLMACEKDFPFFNKLLHDYDDSHFIKPDGSYDLTTNVIRITKLCLQYGFIPNNCQQTVEGFTLFPSDYFCPKDFKTRRVTITENTYTIHHFDGSWLTEQEKSWKMHKEQYPFIPVKILKGISVLKYMGIRSFCKEIVGWIKRKLAGKNVKNS